MKKIIYIALAALAAVSCAKNAGFYNDPDTGEGLVLKFYNSEMTTKAVDGQNNENLIKRIDYFFFPLNAEGTVDDNTEYVYKNSLTPADGGLTGSYTAVVEPGVLSQIFPDGATKAMVFAIANYVDKFGANNDMTGEEDAPLPNTDLPEDAKTWKALHDLEVGPTFFYDDKDPDFLLRWPHVLPTNDPNLFFVMTGELEVNLLTTGSYAIDAEVPLRRLASKVTANFTYEDYLEKKLDKDGKVREIINWVPQDTAGETRVYLSNGIKHTTIGCPLDRTYVADSWNMATKPLGDGTRDLFEYAYNFMNDVPEVEGKKTAHFYTYPINAAEGDDNQPYLKLVLPWYGYKYRGTEENPTYTAGDPDWVLYKQKEVYYKIVLPRESIKDPNCIYEYSVNVNIIGSDKEVKIIGEEYVVKDWLSNNPIGANVATGMYISLEIPKDEYDMYTDEVSIGFVASGTAIARIDTVYQFNYNRSSARPSNVKDPNNLKDYYMINDTYTNSHDRHTEVTNAETVKSWVTIPEGTQQLKISHAMQNDIGTPATFDAAPFVYVVTLHLVEDTENNFNRTITITQYPAMYIVADPNTGYNDIYTQSNITFRSGYTYVNTTEHVWSYLNNGVWYSTSGLYNSGNTNRNMYVVTSTILTVDDLILGDPTGPATSVITDFNGTPSAYGWVSAPGVEGTASRKLSANYRQAEASDRTVNMVAPKIRIASSFGATSDRDYDTQIRRCAAYQEDGHPAGRWRLPTMGEINYLVNLSAKGLIPRLFGNATGSTDYWCANGYVTVSGNTVTKHPNVTSGNRYVRCVYDEWYWGSETIPDRTVFTCGDEYTN